MITNSTTTQLNEIPEAQRAENSIFIGNVTALLNVTYKDLHGHAFKYFAQGGSPYNAAGPFNLCMCVSTHASQRSYG